MTEELTMEKFHVKGLDCAACAAKIEQGLNRLDGVETAVLDFARLTLHVKTNSATRVQDAVRRIDPQVQLLQKSDVMPQEDFSESAASIQSKKELAWLILAGLLFVFQLVSQKQPGRAGSNACCHSLSSSGMECAWGCCKNGTAAKLFR